MTESVSLFLLLLVMILIVLLGVIGIIAIVFMSKRCRANLNQKQDCSESHNDKLDPWVEAGKRVNGDIHEP